MRRLHCGLLLIFLAWGCLAFGVAGSEVDASGRIEGTFVQRRVLGDVGVTLVSQGTFVFEKDVRFVWHVRTPVESVFCATPTNWSFAAAGQTHAQAIAADVSSIGKVFELKEMRACVRRVVLHPATGFPTRVEMDLLDGDRLVSELTRTSCRKH